MVFHGLLHDFDLFGREPLLQAGIRSEDLPSDEMMDGARPTHAEVVIGGSCIAHIDVGSCEASQFEAVLDDSLYMAEAVAPAEIGVAGKDLRLYELHQF